VSSAYAACARLGGWLAMTNFKPRLTKTHSQGALNGSPTILKLVSWENAPPSGQRPVRWRALEEM
jgi:hypothetical protein